MTKGGRIRWGWGILVTLGTLLVLNGLGLYLFEQTGEGQTVGILLTSFGALALAVAIAGFREGHGWAWASMWVVVAGLAALTLHMFSGGAANIGAFYAVLTLVALVGQLLTRGTRTTGAPTPGG